MPEACHELGDLRAAAVDDDRVHADVAHEHDVLREEVGERRVFHRVAAVLDHDASCPRTPGCTGSASARIAAFTMASLAVGGDTRRTAAARSDALGHDVPMFSST